jgi:hypothetical protein
METTATLVPVARPRFAAHNFLAAEGQRRAVVAEAVGVAFAIRTGGSSALLAHDVDIVAALLAM